MQIDAPVSHDVWCWAQKLALQRCKKMPGEKWNLICDVHIFDYAFFLLKNFFQRACRQTDWPKGLASRHQGRAETPQWGQKLYYHSTLRTNLNEKLWMFYTLNIFSNLSNTSEDLWVVNSPNALKPQSFLPWCTCYETI